MRNLLLEQTVENTLPCYRKTFYNAARRRKDGGSDAAWNAKLKK
jgi:hypothetical protein